MSFEADPVSIEELAERLEGERIDWERPHRTQPYNPSRRAKRIGL